MAGLDHQNAGYNQDCPDQRACSHFLITYRPSQILINSNSEWDPISSYPSRVEGSELNVILCRSREGLDDFVQLYLLMETHTYCVGDHSGDCQGVMAVQTHIQGWLPQYPSQSICFEAKTLSLLSNRLNRNGCGSFEVTFNLGNVLC